MAYGGYCITRYKAIVFICLQWWCNLLKKGWLTFYVNLSLAHLVPLGYPSYSPPGITCKNESQIHLTCCLLSHICPAPTTKHEKTFLTVKGPEGHRLTSVFIQILCYPSPEWEASNILRFLLICKSRVHIWQNYEKKTV